MDINNIVSIISSVGFPIFVACALGYIMYKILEKQIALQETINKQIIETLEEIKEEIKALRNERA